VSLSQPRSDPASRPPREPAQMVRGTPMEWFAAPELEQARWLLQRGLALVYLLAFVNIVDQWRGLLGERGLLPVPAFVDRVPFRAAPSLFHWRYSDRWPLASAGSGSPWPPARWPVSRPHGCRPGRACSGGRAVGAVPQLRQRRAGLVRVRVGVAAARGRLPRDLPRRQRRRPACAGPVAVPVAAVPRRVRRRADQDAGRPVLAGPHLPAVPPRDPAAARPVVLVVPPTARSRCTGPRRWPTTSSNSGCRSCCSSHSRSPVSPPPR
jgi:hypothetical protein